jgi:hypothetical protein
MAAAVVVGFGRNDANDGAGVAAVTPKVASVEPYGSANVPVALVDDAQPDAAQASAVDMQRLRAYMLHHARQVALTNQARAVPFVKVAAFESQ